jgi:hypothetical protein
MSLVPSILLLVASKNMEVLKEKYLTFPPPQKKLKTKTTWGNIQYLAAFIRNQLLQEAMSY